MTNDMDLEMDEMKEIIDDFLVEADELIGSLDNSFVALEAAPDDLNLLNEIFRAVHTVKGTSSFLGFEQVTTLSHKMEDILNKLRKSEMAVTPEIMDLLLEGCDLVKVLLDNVRNGVSDLLDLDDILNRLIAANEVGATAEPAAAIDSAPDSGAPGEPDQTETTETTPPEPSEAEPKEFVPIEIPDDVKARMEADASLSDGEPSPASAAETTQEDESKPSEVEQKMSPAGQSATKKQPAATKKPSGEQTIRVDVNRLDTLMNMMGELVLGRNSLVQATNRLSNQHQGDMDLEQINQATTSVNFITTELQMAVMKMRMQPVGKVFNRFPRLVRDLAHNSGKKINLDISGQTTELDKSVIEEIGDPLVHIIRNSCDHGLEMPEDRVAAGKPEVGTVKLMASQEGSNIIIKVQDDGRGLDIDAISAKAVERGLSTQSEIAKMTRQDIFKFIFEAGFSTAKKITDVSGRGVGMDVVRTNIEKLNGMIELDSEKGVGTTLTIKLPLTLAIIQGLLVESDDEVFILPLSSVHETVKGEQSEIFYVNQRPVLRLRDEIIPVINLVEILNSSGAGFQLTEKPYIVVVGLAEKKLGIIIDRFLGQEEVVIKSLGQYLGTTEGVAGATILGDGRIRLIVDLVGLFNIAKRLG